MHPYHTEDSPSKRTENVHNLNSSLWPIIRSNMPISWFHAVAHFPSFNFFSALAFFWFWRYVEFIPTLGIFLSSFTLIEMFYVHFFSWLCPSHHQGFRPYEAFLEHLQQEYYMLPNIFSPFLPLLGATQPYYPASLYSWILSYNWPRKYKTKCSVVLWKQYLKGERYVLLFPSFHLVPQNIRCGDWTPVAILDHGGKGIY